MPAAHPEIVVAAQLATALGGSWAVGSNIFRGPVRPVGKGVPDLAIFVLQSGGPARQPYLGGATAPDRKQPAVQVRVRSASGDYAGGRTLAQSVTNALHKAALTGYAQCLAQSEPLYIGQDQSDHHEWSCNFFLDLSE